MKKILALLIAVTTLLTLFFCGKEHLHEHYELGLFFSIPEDFEARNLSYGDLVYTNGDAYFYINAFDGDTLGEDTIFQDPDLTPIEYTDAIINDLSSDSNVSSDFTYDYDEEKNTTVFEYVYNYEEDYLDSEFYINKVLRTEEFLYVVTFSCYKADMAKYEKIYNKIMDSIKV